MACIILVEDNTLIREAVSGYLQLDNHQTIEFGTTDGVMETIERNVADLAILDVMLPDGNGFSLAKSIRNVSDIPLIFLTDIPLIFLTAKDSESDRILGFELGADDYICKPFSAKELVLRVQALLRRTGSAQDTATDKPSGRWTLENSTALLDTARHLLEIDGTAVSLTGAEWGRRFPSPVRNGRFLYTLPQTAGR